MERNRFVWAHALSNWLRFVDSGCAKKWKKKSRNTRHAVTCTPDRLYFIEECLQYLLNSQNEFNQYARHFVEGNGILNGKLSRVPRRLCAHPPLKKMVSHHVTA